MTVPTMSYIADLLPTRPTNTELRHEGDDWFNEFQGAVQASFPNIAGAVTSDEADLSAIKGLGGTGMVDQLAIYRTGDAPPAAPAFADTLLYVYGVNTNNDSSLMLVELIGDDTGTSASAIRGIAEVSTTAAGYVAVRGEGYLNSAAEYVAGIQGDVWGNTSAVSATIVGVSASFSSHAANQTCIGVAATNYTNYAGRASSRIDGGAELPIAPDIAIGMRVAGAAGNLGGINDSFAWDVGFQVAAAALDQASGGICFEGQADADYGLKLSGAYAVAAIAVNEDEKIVLDLDDSGNTYLTYNSASSRIDFYLDGSLGGYLDASGFGGSSSYGILSVQAGAAGEATVDATPRKIAAWNTNGLSSGTTVDHTDDTIQATGDGVYEVHADLSFSGTASKTYQLEIYVYDDSGAAWGASGFAIDRKLNATGDIEAVSISGIVSLDASDKVAVYQSSSDGGSAMTVTEAQLRLSRVA